MNKWRIQTAASCFLWHGLPFHLLFISLAYGISAVPGHGANGLRPPLGYFSSGEPIYRLRHHHTT